MGPAVPGRRDPLGRDRPNAGHGHQGRPRGHDRVGVPAGRGRGRVARVLPLRQARGGDDPPGLPGRRQLGRGGVRGRPRAVRTLRLCALRGRPRGVPVPDGRQVVGAGADGPPGRCRGGRPWQPIHGREGRVPRGVPVHLPHEPHAPGLPLWSSLADGLVLDGEGRWREGRGGADPHRHGRTRARGGLRVPAHCGGRGPRRCGGPRGSVRTRAAPRGCPRAAAWWDATARLSCPPHPPSWTHHHPSRGRPPCPPPP